MGFTAYYKLLPKIKKDAKFPHTVYNIVIAKMGNKYAIYEIFEENWFNKVEEGAMLLGEPYTSLENAINKAEVYTKKNRKTISNKEINYARTNERIFH